MPFVECLSGLAEVPYQMPPWSLPRREYHQSCSQPGFRAEKKGAISEHFLFIFLWLGQKRSGQKKRAQPWYAHKSGKCPGQRTPKNKSKEAYLAPAPKARWYCKFLAVKCFPWCAEGRTRDSPSPLERKKVLGTSKKCRSQQTIQFTWIPHRCSIDNVRSPSASVANKNYRIT